MKIKVSDYIAGWLLEKNISHVFTVTGGGAMHLNDSFGNNASLKCIYNHHEQACAIAAEGYYKISGNLPAVCVTTGPGGTNALTGVLGAWLDSVPMLIISGQVKFECTIKAYPDLKLRQFGDQEFNIVDTVKTMTKYSVMVTVAEKIKYHLEKAYYMAVNGRPGPVWIDVPLNIQAAIIDTEDLEQYDMSEDVGETPPAVTNETIKSIIESIKNADRPVIMAGSGIRLGKAKEQFDKFIKMLNIPVMTAWNSHDLVPDNLPLYAGRPGTIGTRGGNFVFQSCDLLLVLGCRMNLRQIGYVWDNIAEGAYKIMVDIDPAELQKRSFRPDMPIYGDCLDFIEKMTASGYRKETPENEKWIKWCNDINLKYSSLRDITKGKKLNPYVFFDDFFKLLPEGQITVCSNGSACVIPFQTAKIKSGQRLFSNSGCASMGYGLPASIGACVASGNKKTVCLEGDGSIQMNIQELQTIIQNKLPIKIFIINNNGYHSIRQTQANFFKSHFVGVDNRSGVSFPDFKKIAKAYGLQFFRIDSENGVKTNIKKAMEFDLPVICEVVVDYEQQFMPKSSSKILPDGRMISAPLQDMYPFLEETEMQQNKFTSDRG